MRWISDELLLYGGIAVCAVSILAAIICICLFKVKSIKIKAQLDKEYGECIISQKEKK